MSVKKKYPRPEALYVKMTTVVGTGVVATPQNTKPETPASRNRLDSYRAFTVLYDAEKDGDRESREAAQ